MKIEIEVWQHGFIDKDWKLTCKYKKILVNNDEEHNEAFELLEMWLDNKFKKYKNFNFNFIYKLEEGEQRIMEDKRLKNFLEYLQDKVQDCYKEETRIAIERFLEGE